MKNIRLQILALNLLMLSACSINYDGRQAVSSQYCDNFLVYDMCARDLNDDGQVDLVYFTDSSEVFMFRGDEIQRVPPDLGVHRCARRMDEDLVATTSRLFFIDNETTYLEKQDIRGAMMIKYIAYMPEVTACQLRNQQSGAGDESS